jgi:dTDP-4-amino-4,6-dideoxygalactose transaminase
MSAPIPFNRPYTVGTEFAYISEVLRNGHLSGGGPFANRCSARLAEITGAARVLLTPSATAALEMMPMLGDIGPGDEVIMPSFTFVTTASAFARSGATPVFVDIRPDTLNLDECLVEAAITERTRAVVAVHYAGVGCEMDRLSDICTRHGLRLYEDAAQGILANFHGQPLGAIGELGAISFHETKNVTCGEGGALLVNDPALIERAEILHEKGTNRTRFLRGQVDKYTWVDIGSSYTLSDLNAAFLWAQLEHAEEITGRRLDIWRRYHEAFAPLEERGIARRPLVPEDCVQNAHMYYLLMRDQVARDGLIADLADRGIQAVFHYVPLHSAPAGLACGRTHGDLAVTNDTSARLVRLPLFLDLEPAAVAGIIDAVYASVGLPASAARS